MSDEATMERALALLDEAEARIEALERGQGEPIAIVGIGCRFPGGVDEPDGFWRLLAEGRSAIREVPEGRWGRTPEPAHITLAGFLDDDVYGFDPAAFGIAPREAKHVDPQQRMFLEVACDALENAAIPIDSLSGSATGVYAAICAQDYRDLCFAGAERLGSRGDVYSLMGSLMSALAGRVAYQLGLQGPAITLDTACSSSLVAIHLACRSLAFGESDLGLAGGVNLILSPASSMGLAHTSALSTDGRCFTFDARANGFVRGEGVGVVALKRLADAEEDGDRIWAVIRGSAINHDGRTSGLSVPNVGSQEDVLRAALDNARLEPPAIDYVETHGTGTSLGDPIEVEALKRVYARAERSQPLHLGALKTNLGHLEAASGVAGVIKAALALHHESIPSLSDFQTLNPHITLDAGVLAVAKRAVPWPRGPEPRHAAVSSFGMSGTNANVVLEEAPRRAPRPEGRSNRAEVLVLSAHTETALADLAGRMATMDPEPLSDVAATLQTGRAHRRVRAAVVAENWDHARTQLQALRDGQARDLATGRLKHHQGVPRVAFFFTGQGSQAGGMGLQLAEHEPVVKEALAECAAIVDPLLDRSLLSLFDDDALHETRYTQPALVALQYALGRLLASWGIEPDVVVGHSVGEISAVHAAGACSIADALRFAVARGAAMQETPPGAMMALRCSEADALAAIADSRVSVASVNGPASVVLSGPQDDLREVAARLGMEGRSLKTTRAFHSSLMDPALAAIEAAAASVEWRPARRPIASNVTGRIESDAMLKGRYWVRHAREAVRFSAATEALAELGYDLAIEVGPHPVLTTLVAEVLEEAPPAVATLRRGVDELEAIGAVAATAFVRGVDLKWDALAATRGGRVRLPTFPYDRQHYIAEEAAAALVSSRRALPQTQGTSAIYGASVETPGIEDRFAVDLEATDAIEVHGTRIASPGRLLMNAIALAPHCVGTASANLVGVRFSTPLRLRDGFTTLHTVAGPAAKAGRHEVRLSSRGDSGDWVEHLRAELRPPEDTRGANSFSAALEGPQPQRWDGETLTSRLSAFGVSASASASVQEVLSGPQTTTVALNAASSLDAGLLAIGASRAAVVGGPMLLPSSIEQVRVLSEGEGVRWNASWRPRDPSEPECADVWVEGASGIRLLEVRGMRFAVATPETFRRTDGAQFLDWLYEIRWAQSERASGRPSGDGRWVVFEDALEHGARVAAALRDGGADVQTVVRGSEYAAGGPDRPFVVDPTAPDHVDRLLADLDVADQPLSGVVYAWPIETEVDANPQALSCAGLLHVIQAMTRTQQRRLFVLSRGAQAVQASLQSGRGGEPASGGDLIAPHAATAWGLGRTAFIEEPLLRLVLIDLDPSGSSADNAAFVMDELSSSDDESQVAYRAGQRFVGRLARVEAPSQEPTPVAVRDDRLYLITGGLGGVGLNTARWLLARGARHFALLTRSGANSATRKAAVAELEAQGATVHTPMADASDRGQLEEVVDSLRAQCPPFGGVVHSVATLDNGVLLDQEWTRVWRGLKVKVNSAVHLDALLSGDPLDFVAYHSSTTSPFGAPGQGSYAAANAFLDAYAQVQRARNQRAVSFNWGPWGGGGLLSKVPQLDRERIQDLGFHSIDAERGGEVFLHTLDHGIGQVIVMNVDWWKVLLRVNELRRVLDEGMLPGWLRSAGHLRGRLAQMPTEQWPTALRATLEEIVEQVLGWQRGAIDIDAPFGDLGMDSLAALEIRNRLSVAIDEVLPMRVVYDHPTIDALSGHLATRLGDDGSGGGSPVATDATSLSLEASVPGTEPS